MMIRKIFCFAFVGVCGFLVDCGIVLLIVSGFGGSPYYARFFSFVGAVATTCLLNSKLTFREQKPKYNGACGFLIYTGLMLFGLACNYTAYALLLYFVFPESPTALALLAAVACGSLAGMFVNFTSCHFWFFADQPFSKCSSC
ncbi:MAG: GtrA family protein [Planctomycetaceae bacterium]|nr:GtrA family protein [Planctomycetaceae bacterium]